MVLLSMIVYFVFYPKIHYEYYLMLFAVAIPYLIEKRNLVVMLYVISLLTSITLLIEQRYLDWKTTTYAYPVFVSIAIGCMVAVDIILIYIFYHVSKSKTWIDSVEENRA